MSSLLFKQLELLYIVVKNELVAIIMKLHLSKTIIVLIINDGFNWFSLQVFI